MVVFLASLNEVLSKIWKWWFLNSRQNTIQDLCAQYYQVLRALTIVVPNLLLVRLRYN